MAAYVDKLSPSIYGFFQRFLGLLFRWRFALRAEGVERVPREGGLIIATNHASFLDPPLMGVVVRQRCVRFMARDSLFNNKILGWLYYRFGVVPLDRTKGDVAAIKTAIRLLKDGQCVALFPEGTRTTDGNLQDAKGGIGFLIHKAHVPVVPAYIHGSFEAFPKGSKKILRHPIVVVFGAPINAETLQLNDERGKPDYAAIGRLVMAQIARLKPVEPTQ